MPATSPSPSVRAAIAVAALLATGTPVPAQEVEADWAGATATPPVGIEIASGKAHLLIETGDWGRQWWLLDTGANMSVVDRRVALDRGLTLRNEQTGTDAAGNRTFEYAFTELPAMRLGGIGIAPRPVAVIDRQTRAANGHASIGLLGADFFRAFVVDIDYSARTLRLRAPEAFAYQGPGEVLPLRFDENGKPHVDGVLVLDDGTRLDMDLLVDTGDRGLLTLSRPFVEANALEERVGRSFLATVGVGVGGEVEHRVARVGALEVGRSRIERPYLDMPPAGSGGAYARADRSGVLGATFLGRFRVIFDYPGSRLVLEPRAVGEGAPAWDASGTFLVATGADFEEIRILSVTDGGPAAEAGLEEGDRILSIDGADASSLGLDQARELLRRPDRRVELRVERDGRSFDVVLSTRALL